MSNRVTDHQDARLAALAAQFPRDVLVSDMARVDKYRMDRANDYAAGMPLAVVRAQSTEHVQAAVRFAAMHGIPVVPRGSGTGLSGGASAVEGSIVISLERMRALTVDPTTLTADVEAGVLNAELKAAAAAHGLWYPPDPSSYEICSMGGNVATNAGGLCCVKYGVTGDYVLGLTVVLADASKVELGGPRLKDVAGLPLTKLFVGSEGTLGIVTRMVVRLLPAQRKPATLVAAFVSLDDVVGAVLDITRQLRPSMLEFMDNTAINAVEDVARMGLDRGAAGLLIVQSDESEIAAVEEIALIGRICDARNAAEWFSTADVETGAAFVAARRMAVPALERKGALLLEDVGVPLFRLGELVRGIADVASELDLTIALVAHAGDGNTHPLIVYDPIDTGQTARAQDAFGRIMRLAIDLGGTITGEHGVGRLKRPWLEASLGSDVLALNQKIKTALDPLNILNPGSGL